MQKNDRGTVGGAGLGVSDIQQAGVDLLERAEDALVPRLTLDRSCRLCLARLCTRGTDHAEPGSGHRHGRRSKEAAAIKVRVRQASVSLPFRFFRHRSAAGASTADRFANPQPPPLLPASGATRQQT